MELRTMGHNGEKLTNSRGVLQSIMGCLRVYDEM